jgi:microcystin-dependent protein
MGELRIWSFGFTPRGWAQCNGQLLPLNQNQALFSLLGTTYGGNGFQNFALPNLQGRIPLHIGQGLILGQTTGEENHTLTLAETPAHNHPINATSTAGSQIVPGGNLFANAGDDLYASGLGNSVVLASGTLTNTGGSLPHPNQQPYLVMNICISLTGIFPSRN